VLLLAERLGVTSPGRGAVVACIGEDGSDIARGLTNYDAAELRKIQGAKTKDLEGRLGYKRFDEVIHRDNLVLL